MNPFTIFSIQTSSNYGLRIKKNIIGIKKNIQKDQTTIIGIKTKYHQKPIS